DLTTGQVLRNQNVAGTAAVLALALGDRYQWWVRSVSSAGVAGPWSSGATFRAVSLPAPQLLGPAGAVASLPPALSWAGVAGDDHSGVWVNDRTTGQNQVIRSPNVSGTSFTPADPLVFGHAYRFWVRSVDALGNASAWSLGLDLTIA